MDICFARLFPKVSVSVTKHSLKYVKGLGFFNKKQRLADLEQTSSFIKQTDLKQDAIFILIILLSRFITRYVKDKANLGLVVHFLCKSSEATGHDFLF